ncbi:caspase family protein, partial [Moorena sp. SIO3B2]|uniref:nSTAND1 domain-containing NTPase n=2 Tax=unclassified Moorena TaxID=2683338 RepID=UPI0013C5750C
TENDRLLFYFAGHGVALNGDDGPAGYLIPQDALLGDTNSYLPMTKLHDALSQLPCRHFLGILDCCFAGAFKWSSTRDLLTSPEVIHQERYDRFISDPAWQIITSSASDQKALDNFNLDSERGQFGNHSPFASALLEALEGAADIYPPATNGKPAGDGVITATKLYLYLRDRVEIPTEKCRLRQTPGIWCLNKHDKGEYIFLSPGHELNLPPAPPLDESQNPYRGLKSFEEKHSSLFFGRTLLVEKLEDFVKANPLTVVLGASGSGKSSLVKAGLIPKLRQDNTEKWCILPPIRPGETPLPPLNNVLFNAKLPNVEPQNPQQNLAMSIDVWGKNNPNSKLLLFIDQSEEIITLCQNLDQRKEFFQQILTAINGHGDKLRVVLTLRSDFEPQVRDAGLKFVPTDYNVENTVLTKRWHSGRFIVPAMTRGELREAIEKPAQARVMYFQPHELVEKLIDEVADMPGALPLLSFALSELFLKYLRRQREAQYRGITIDRALTQADYQELGGVMRSLTQRADLEYEALVNENPAYDQLIRHVMLRMVALGGGELARRRVPLSELEYPPAKNGLVKEVIDCFSTARLLVEGQDSEGNPDVEPAHDALVRGWQRLLGWKQQEEESLLLQRRLTTVAQEWKSQQQAKFLWNANPRLDLLKKVYLSDDNWLNQVEVDFVRRSVRKKRRNTMVGWSIAGSVLLGAMIFSAAVWNQWRNSELNNANSLGRYSLSLFAEHKEMEAFVEAIRAGKILQKHKKSDPQVMSALQKVLYEGSERNRLQRHTNIVSSVSFSRDGQTLASGSDDNTIKLWNRKTGKLIRTLPGHTGPVNSVSFSPNGKTLASGSNDETIKLWNPKTGKLIRTLIGHDNVVNSVSFSRDGQTLASSSTDNTIKLWDPKTGKVIRTIHGYDHPLWDPKTGKVIRTLHGHTGHVNSVSFSRDGQTLASGSTDNTIKLWDPKTGKEIRTLHGHDNVVNSVSFSRDGQTLASGSTDNTIKLWDPKTGKEIRTLNGHDDLVTSVSFSRDGQTLASSSQDNTIKLWNLVTGKEIRTLNGHDDLVTSVSFSRDGQTLASGSFDNTIKLWNLVTEREIRPLIGHDNSVSSVSFSRDGKTVAFDSDDNTIKLWNLETGTEIRTLHGDDNSVSSVSFSRDGKTLAVGSSYDNYDHMIQLWNLETGTEIRTLHGHNDSFHKRVTSLSFSPDGQTLASGSDDRTIKLWNLETGTEIRTLPGHDNSVKSVSFSPDGQTLASGSDDRTIKLWNLETGTEIRTLIGHDDWVNSISFSRDGQTLASGSGDKTIKLWNLETGTEIRTLIGHDQLVTRVSFSPDGQTLASGSNDETIKLWNLETGTEIRTLIGHDDWVISVSFSPDGQTLASGSSDGTIKLWHLDLNLDSLMARSCDWVRNYLQNNPNVSENDRHLCDNGAARSN